MGILQKLLKSIGLNSLLRISERCRAPRSVGASIRQYSFNETDRTTVHVMNKDLELGLMVDSFSQVGFKLNNRITVLGPMIIFPRSVLSWNVGDIEDVDEDSLSLFKILVPKIDILVLGTGDKVEGHDIFVKFLKYSRANKIAVEVLPTEAACATFNFLNAEGRSCVGAFIPPKTIKFYSDDDVLKTQIRYHSIIDRT